MSRVRVADALDRSRHVRLYSITTARAKHPKGYREDLEHLLGWLAQGRIAPRVAATFSFADGADAHRRLEEGDVDGQLVIIPGQASPS